MSGWVDLWGESDEDDEDYDPFQDEALGIEDDSESDSFEALRQILSPRRRKGKFINSSAPSPGDVICRRTRTHLQIPDDILKEADTQLERAERVLEPCSPNDKNVDDSNVLAIPEYQRLLAVARGQAEMDEVDDDEDDEDFIPGSDVECEGVEHADDDDEMALGDQIVSVSRKELKDLVAESRAIYGDTDAFDSTKSSTYAVARRKRLRRHWEGGEANGTSETWSCDTGNGDLQVGLTPDHCTQLQGQLRDYLQLAVQEYVLTCSQLTDVIGQGEAFAEAEVGVGRLYDGLAELFRVWEVTSEYGRMQTRAMEVLSRHIMGAPPKEPAAVQLRPNAHFSFFDIPGVELIPHLLESVSRTFSRDSNLRTSADNGTPSRNSGQVGGMDGNCSVERRKCIDQALALLEPFAPHFNKDLELLESSMLPASSIGALGGSAATADGFTPAEDHLMLAGLRRFGTEWELVRTHLLPTKSLAEIKARFRRLVRRDEPENPVKNWKLSRAAGLTDKERNLLQRGVAFFGPRFDLIADRLLVHRSEKELRRAYERMRPIGTQSKADTFAADLPAAKTSSAWTSENSTAHTQSTDSPQPQEDSGTGERRGRRKKRKLPSAEVNALFLSQPENFAAEPSGSRSNPRATTPGFHKPDSLRECPSEAAASSANRHTAGWLLQRGMDFERENLTDSDDDAAFESNRPASEAVGVGAGGCDCAGGLPTFDPTTFSGFSTDDSLEPWQTTATADASSSLSVRCAKLAASQPLQLQDKPHNGTTDSVTVGQHAQAHLTPVAEPQSEAPNEWSAEVDLAIIQTGKAAQAATTASASLDSPSGDVARAASATDLYEQAFQALSLSNKGGGRPAADLRRRFEELCAILRGMQTGDCHLEQRGGCGPPGSSGCSGPSDDDPAVAQAGGGVGAV